MRDRLRGTSFLPLRNRGSRIPPERGVAAVAARPTISRPVGPVHRNNGPDLERAREITVVSSISEARPVYRQSGKKAVESNPDIPEGSLGISIHDDEHGDASNSPRANRDDDAQAYGDTELTQPSGTPSTHASQPGIQSGSSHQLHLNVQRRRAAGDRQVLAEISHPNAPTRISSRDRAALKRHDSADQNGEKQLMLPRSSGLPSTCYRGARRLSASFSNGGPLSSDPTVASHSISAVMGTAAGCSTTACAQSSAGTADASNTADTAGYSTCDPIEVHTSAHGDDNTVPKALDSAARIPVLADYGHNVPFSQRLSQHQLPQPSGRRDADKKRLPKSRTLTVLSNLTASLSRSSLANFAGSERKSSQHTVSSRKTSSSSTFASNAPTRTATPTSPEVNPLIITTAQPSAYWSGRFLSLQDRFQGESLQEKTLSIFVTAHASKSTILAQQREVYQRRGNLPLSTTTALDRYGTNAAVQEAERLSDEDNRCLRIFLHLDALCGTPEAQKSLHTWQEAYARRAGRDVLLPQGASVEKGFVARLFSGSSRRSLGSSRSGKETTKGKQLLTAF
ncbi:hypothetical protein CTA1_6138 [Colletotrichum tanaceti]|uniref:Uncharacterized protein n=1 Tax=Colletotrichum tanaceti TaxID=1306861 RepID=A0A4U6X445_9PEZI|nr:hypothetical protein CTA1_6138 [Colletotrichum tanaceti]